MFNTLPANPFPPSSEQMGAGGGGGSYVLPVASADTLGGVKVGSNLSIADGVLSAPAPYTPIDYSTTEQNTGIKWIDGKDIFQKVYHVDNLGNNVDTTLEEGFSISKTLIKTEGVITTIIGDEKYQYSASYYANSNDCAFVCVQKNDLVVRTKDNYSNYSGDFIVYYTKTESEG